MKTTELMVGDWVMGSLGDRGRVVAIDDEDNYKTHHGSVRIKYSEDFAANGEWVDKISHIPLTAEILEKNGFKPGSKEYNSFDPDYFIPGMPHSSFGLELNEGYFCITDHTLMRLHYVHELQHALRLCELHELADNFKI